MEDDYEYHKFNLATAKRNIKNWTSRYFKANSKKRASIKLRVWCVPEESIFWKYYIELNVDGKMIEQTRITQEAFDTLNCDPNLERTDYTGVGFTTLKKINIH